MLSYCRRTDGQILVRYQCVHIMGIGGQLNIIDLVHGNNFIYFFLFYFFIVLIILIYTKTREMDYFFLCRHDRNKFDNVKEFYFSFRGLKKSKNLCDSMRINLIYMYVCILRYRRCTHCDQS